MDRKFKVGDRVMGNRLADDKYRITKYGYIGVVTKMLYGTTIVLDEKYVVDENYFTLLDKPEKHEGKILIMVDEQDNNKIVARDLITGKKAEAKCNPKDEWDFNKGAKLAFERLTESEKPKEEKGWTGKVIYTGHSDSYYFTIGRVYKVETGLLYDNTQRPWYGYIFHSLEELNATISGGFIEYKGGAEE